MGKIHAPVDSAFGGVGASDLFNFFCGFWVFSFDKMHTVVIISPLFGCFASATLNVYLYLYKKESNIRKKKEEV